MELKGRIVVYSTVGCPHCMRAKATLQEQDLSYTDINLEDFPHCREYVYHRIGKRTVPQIFFNSFHLGGNDDLQKLIKEDPKKFQQLVEDVKNNPPSSDAPEIPDPSTRVTTDDALGFACEPDENAMLVGQLKTSGIITDHRQMLVSQKNTFTGKDFVDWVVKSKELDRESAKEMGKQLVDQHFCHPLKGDPVFKDDNTLYRLLEHDDSKALNAGPVSDCEPRPAGEVGEQLRKVILKIYGAFLSKDGRGVEYKKIGGSDEFKKYVQMTQELKRISIADTSRAEKLAFFSNIYNALVIHAKVVYGHPVNTWQRYQFFYRLKYIIGGHEYSLQDLENGVLRANRKGVGMLMKPFGKNDPRLAVALEKPEPLIHFALVCGAKGCPPIKTYSADGVYEQLQEAAESFMEGDEALQVDTAKKEVQLSRIFKWYREDFGSNNEEVLKWIHEHIGEGEKKTQLGEVMNVKGYKVSFMPYDWGTNEK